MSDRAPRPSRLALLALYRRAATGRDVKLG
jgi:hypothetical protein